MKKDKKCIKLGFKVERSNELNLLRPNGMNLTEIRFLAIYQAKINARNPESRTVTFSLEEFCDIMNIKRVNITPIKNIIDDLLCKPIHLPCSNGVGFIAVPLFNKCEVNYDIKGEWYVKIQCHEDAIPYMFEMKRNYFTYELWNALKLKSVNQIRMYEILKQYEKLGERVVSLNDLRLMLGINNAQYKKFKDFRIRVLESCQQALAEYTDIIYDFEPIRIGRKIENIKFTINKNLRFKDDLRLKEFIKPEDLEDIQEDLDIMNQQNIIDIDIIQSEDYSDEIKDLYYKCNKHYTMEQLEIISNMIESSGLVKLPIPFYILSLYQRIKSRNTEIQNWYAYTLKTITKDLEDKANEKENIPKIKNENYIEDMNKPSFNLEEWKKVNSTCPRRMSDEECFFVLDDFDNTIGFVFESDFDKIVDGTWRKLNNRFSNGHLSPESDLGRSLMSLKK